MRESYTFSRALHLMRYGRERMKHTAYAKGVYLYYDLRTDCLMIHFPSGKEMIAPLDGLEIAGSFTRYVPELDGA